LSPSCRGGTRESWKSLASSNRIALPVSLAAGAALAAPPGLRASSHREAPGITEKPKVDGTDLYMFRSYEAGRDDITFRFRFRNGRRNIALDIGPAGEQRSVAVPVINVDRSQLAIPRRST
jgi:hypothetical protein